MALFTQIAKGIQAMRKCNVVHRDLKPANILLKQGIVKISDFGFATKSNGKLMESYKGSLLSMAP
jgi:serine/threonine-protein kinase ULK/ATG1